MGGKENLFGDWWGREGVHTGQESLVVVGRCFLGGSGGGGGGGGCRGGGGGGGGFGAPKGRGYHTCSLVG